MLVQSIQYLLFPEFSAHLKSINKMSHETKLKTSTTKQT